MKKKDLNGKVDERKLGGPPSKGPVMLRFLYIHENIPSESNFLHTKATYDIQSGRKELSPLSIPLNFKLFHFSSISLFLSF